MFCRIVMQISRHVGIHKEDICLQYARTNRLRFYSTKNKNKLEVSYIHGESDVRLLGSTIGQLLDKTSEQYPDREAFVFCHDHIRKTFQQFHHDVQATALGFISAGLQRGDRLGMWGPNSYEWILTQYAAAKMGIILVNVNPAYQQRELEFALHKVGCKGLVSADSFKTQDYYEMLFALCPELAVSTPGHLHSHILPRLRTIIMLGKERYPGTFTFNDIMERGGEREKRILEDTQVQLQFDDPINIQFTSGTTGGPKGATLSHHNILNNAYYVGIRTGYHNHATSICTPNPLYHCFGNVLASLQTVIHGATVVFPAPSFDPEAALKAVHQERCTSLYGTPTMFIDMLNHPNFSKYDLSSLYTGIMAGSPCPVEVMKQVTTKMHMPQVTICYGTTENSPVTFQSLMSDPIEKRVSTIGVPSAHVEVKVVDSESNIVPINTTGELCTRGYTTMLYYWKDEDKTRSVISADRWYHTGDMGYIDEDGYGHISGRVKDMIIRGGENIYPLELEEFLYKHPKIEDVQVIGVPDERLGEEICAWIKLHSGETATELDIKAFCKGKISHFKIPRYIKFVEEYPLTVTGKVKKFKMREQAVEQLNLTHVKPHMESDK